MIDRSTNIREALRRRQRGFIINPFRFGGANTDPNFASVSCLLHFAGADASTTITDSGPNGETFAVAGDAAVTTDQSKFGGSAFETTTGRAYCTNEAPFLFADGNFTVECWVYIGSAPAAEICFCGVWGTSNTTISWYFGLNASRNLIFYHRRNGSNVFAFNSIGTVSTGAWHHVAFTRNGSTTSFWIDGADGGYSGSSIGTFALAAPTGIDFTVGALHANTNQIGAGRYLDDVRVTKGVARYTSAFSAPTAAFPDS